MECSGAPASASGPASSCESCRPWSLARRGSHSSPVHDGAIAALSADRAITMPTARRAPMCPRMRHLPATAVREPMPRNVRTHAPMQAGMRCGCAERHSGIRVCGGQRTFVGLSCFGMRIASAIMSSGANRVRPTSTSERRDGREGLEYAVPWSALGGQKGRT